jgi:succinyl-CoA synthetase alpha subunit
MTEKTKREQELEDIETLKELVEEKVSNSDGKMSKEDALFDICTAMIEASVKQSQAIEMLSKAGVMLADKIAKLEMRLSVVENAALPLLQNMPCAGEC